MRLTKHGIEKIFQHQGIQHSVEIDGDSIRFKAEKPGTFLFQKHDSIEKIKQSLFTNIHRSSLEIQHEIVTIRFVKMCYGYMNMQKLIS